MSNTGRGGLNVGAGFPGLLKDGYKHLSGLEEAVLKNTEAVVGLSNIVRTSFGPNGMNKLLINHLERLFVTSDAATICSELEVQHPAAKMVAMTAKRQQDEFGDFTNFVITFSGELMKQAQDLIRVGVHVADIIEGYKVAGEKATAYLPDLIQADAEITDVRDHAALVRAIFPVICAKQYGQEDLITPLVATACQQTMPRSGPASINTDNVRVAKLMGGALIDSEVVTGMVVKQLAHGIVKRVHNAKVAVFGCALESSSTETKSTVVINDADELKAYNKGEEQMMEDSIQEIAESGVKVVVCGSTVSEMAQHFLDKYGMMMIKIQSKFELRRVCRATGATAIVRIGAPTVEECGFIGDCYIREFGDRKVTVFAQDDSVDGMEGCRVATIVLRGTTTNGLDEVERAINDGVATVKTLCNDGRMLPGAGSTDIALAHRISSYATTLPGLEQYAVQKFATALEVFPRVLAENRCVARRRRAKAKKEKCAPTFSFLLRVLRRRLRAGDRVPEEEVRRGSAACVPPPLPRTRVAHRVRVRARAQRRACSLFSRSFSPSSPPTSTAGTARRR